MKIISPGHLDFYHRFTHSYYGYGLTCILSRLNYFSYLPGQKVGWIRRDGMNKIMFYVNENIISPTNFYTYLYVSTGSLSLSVNT